MHPAYRGMTGCPYQRNRTPSATYYYPSREAVQPEMKEDPPNSSCTEQSWPHNYGYQAPMMCQNYYNHSQCPPYYDFRPPCSHFPHLMPPPLPPAYNHFCGGYSPYPQPSYPIYHVPPPHYSVDMPRYGYDKSVPRHQFHCCGCPNHRCHMEGRNGVKIEEQEPDGEIKKGEPLSLDGANNLLYPIVWVPPGFTPNKEQPINLAGDEAMKAQMPRRSMESEVQNKKGSLHGKKPQWSPGNGNPNFRYRWFPLDLNSIKRLTESGDVKRTHDQEKRSEDEKTDGHVGNKDQIKHMSYPIIWVPYDNLLKDHLEEQVENTAGRKAIGESPATFSVSPRKSEHADDESGNGKIVSGNDDQKVSTLGAEKKTSNVRTIPVKQIEEPVPNSPKKEEDLKPSSSTKKPKLPPICLRVDPPKKKNGKGSSRSPSPPGDKKQQDTDEIELELKSKHPQKIKVKDLEDKKPKVNKIELSHDTSEADGVEKKVQPDNSNKSGIFQCGDGKVQTQESQASEAGGVEKKEAQFDNNSVPGDAKCGDDKVQAQETHAVREGEAEPEQVQKRRVMSEIEAAILIQSAYRGYNLRRWEPLKKLKAMHEVREEALQVKKKIEDLESRDSLDDEVNTIIGETIMKLLLKLDTIQGLHESIREVRRSLAKELISLQEKLDSIKKQAQDNSIIKAAEPRGTSLVEASEGIAEVVEDLSKGSSLDATTNTQVSEMGSSDTSSNQPLPCHDDVCFSIEMVTEESLPMSMESWKETQDNLSMSSSMNKAYEAIKISEPPEEGIDATTTTMEPEENALLSSKHDQEQDDVIDRTEDHETDLLSELPQEVVEEDEKEIPHAELVIELSEGGIEGRGVDVQEVVEVEKEMPLAEVVTESFDRNQDPNANILTELPQEVVEDNENHDKAVSSIEGQEVDLLSELPVEVVEDDEKVIPPADLIMEFPEKIETQGADPQEVNREGNNDVSLAELVMDSSNNHEPNNIFSELPLEVGEEDAKEIPLSQNEILGNLNDDNQREARIGNNEDTLAVISNNNPLKVHVEETQIGLDEIADNAENFNIPSTKEEGTKLEELTSAMESVEAKETSNAELSSESTSLTGPPRNKYNEISETSNVQELIAGDQEHDSQTQGLHRGASVGEPVMQQHEAVNQQVGQVSEVQSSVIADENELQVEKKVEEENEKLRELLAKLIMSGKEQQEVISSLSDKVKDMEKKLANRKTKSAKHPRIKVARSCGKPANGALRDRPMGTTS